MSNELEEFLRRAAQRRAARQAQSAGGPPTAVPQPPTPTRTIAQPVQEIQYLEPLEAEVIEAEPVAKRHAVEQHVAQRLNTQEFAERVSHLAERVEQADDQLESHVHAAFDHAVGKLSHEAPAQVMRRDEESSLVKGLWTAFRDANRLQQAVLMSEILHRPEHRW